MLYRHKTLSNSVRRAWTALKKAPNVNFVIASSPNRRWSQTSRGQSISVPARPIMTSRTRICAIGSCFAGEIRRAFRANGYDVYPKYFDINFDPTRQNVAGLPRRDNMNLYTTFSIRQEIEHALDRTLYGTDALVVRRSEELVRLLGWNPIIQDPYHSKVYGADVGAVLDIAEKINESVRTGLEVAEIVIITLGLTEAWRNRSNGLYVCRGPANEKDELFGLLKFHRSGYSENYENVMAVVNRIHAIDDQKTIVLTVSPVPLNATWTGEDIVVANAASKSTLRSVADAVCREVSNVVYWPSYECCVGRDVYEKDGRHIRADVVTHIVNSFAAAHMAV